MSEGQETLIYLIKTGKLFHNTHSCQFLVSERGNERLNNTRGEIEKQN